MRKLGCLWWIFILGFLISCQVKRDKVRIVNVDICFVDSIVQNHIIYYSVLHTTGIVVDTDLVAIPLHTLVRTKSEVWQTPERIIISGVVNWSDKMLPRVRLASTESVKVIISEDLAFLKVNPPFKVKSPTIASAPWVGARVRIPGKKPLYPLSTRWELWGKSFIAGTEEYGKDTFKEIEAVITGLDEKEGKLQNIWIYPPVNPLYGGAPVLAADGLVGMVIMGSRVVPGRKLLKHKELLWSSLPQLPQMLAQKSKEGSSEATYILGVSVLTENGSFESFKRAHDLFNYGSEYYLGEGLMDALVVKKAIDEIDFKSSTDEEKNFYTLLAYGEALLFERRLSEAESLLLCAAKMAPADPTPRFLLGLALFGQNKYEKAIQSFEEAKWLDPGFEEARIMKELVKYEYTSRLNSFVCTDSSHLLYHVTAGLYYAQRGMATNDAELLERAIEHLQKARYILKRQFYVCEEINVLLAECLLRVGEYERARIEMEDIQSMHKVELWELPLVYHGLLYYSLRSILGVSRPQIIENKESVGPFR